MFTGLIYQTFRFRVLIVRFNGHEAAKPAERGYNYVG